MARHIPSTWCLIGFLIGKMPRRLLLLQQPSDGFFYRCFDLRRDDLRRWISRLNMQAKAGEDEKKASHGLL
jgi:hypothetical protein